MYILEVGILKHGVLKEKEKYKFNNYNNALSKFNELYNNDILKGYDYIRLYDNNEVDTKIYKYYTKTKEVDFIY